MRTRFLLSAVALGCLLGTAGSTTFLALTLRRWPLPQFVTLVRLNLGFDGGADGIPHHLRLVWLATALAPLMLLPLAAWAGYRLVRSQRGDP